MRIAKCVFFMVMKYRENIEKIKHKKTLTLKYRGNEGNTNEGNNIDLDERPSVWNYGLN